MSGSARLPMATCIGEKEEDSPRQKRDSRYPHMACRNSQRIGKNMYNDKGKDRGCQRQEARGEESSGARGPFPKDKGDMERLIDIHCHVGHRFEWTQRASELWMDTGPYVPELYDETGQQIPQAYGDTIKKEAWAGILIPEYSPGTAGVMPFERAE